MLIALDRTIFANSTDVDIKVLVTLATKNGHLLTLDDASQEYLTWTAQERTLSARISGYLRVSSDYINSGRGKSMIYVHADGSDWTGTAPRLNISDAIDFLLLPFRIFVENHNADIAFLTAFMSKEMKREFEDLQIKGRIQIVHGGGLGDLQAQLSKEIIFHNRPDLRTFVFFDNDGLYPNSPSSSSKRLQEECRKNNIKHHQLKRRSIENYVSSTALNLWVYNNKGKNKRALALLLEAYQTLTEAQRDHFNMKTGATGDLTYSQRDKYSNISNYHRKKLSIGFGTKFSSVFSDENFAWNSSDKELVRANLEVAPMINRIFASI